MKERNPCSNRFRCKLKLKFNLRSELAKKKSASSSTAALVCTYSNQFFICRTKAAKETGKIVKIKTVEEVLGKRRKDRKYVWPTKQGKCRGEKLKIIVCPVTTPLLLHH